MQDQDLDALLRALDETPSTPQELARRLGWDLEEVARGLDRLEEASRAVDWGGVWATTWRAKVDLAPRFFRIWVPTSVALGVGFSALALALNGPVGDSVWLPIGLAVVAVLALGLGLSPLAEEGV